MKKKKQFDCVRNEKNIDIVNDFDHFALDIFVVNNQFAIVVNFVVDERFSNFVDMQLFHVLQSIDDFYWFKVRKFVLWIDM